MHKKEYQYIEKINDPHLIASKFYRNHRLNKKIPIKTKNPNNSLQHILITNEHFHIDP